MKGKVKLLFGAVVLILSLFAFSGCELSGVQEPVIVIRQTDVTQTTMDISITVADISGGSISKVELIKGNVSTTFDNKAEQKFTGLMANSNYTVRVTYDYSINGEAKTIVKELDVKTAAYSKPLFFIEKTKSTVSGVWFDIDEADSDEIGKVEKIELLDSTGAIIQSNPDARSFENLSDNSEYTVRVVYSYDLMEGAGKESVTKTLRIKTERFPYEPQLFAYVTEKDQTSVKFDIFAVDFDNVGELSKIELVGKTGTLTASNINVRSFSGLTPNSEYTIKITYSYDIGEGAKNLVYELKVKTDEELLPPSVPEMFVFVENVTQTSLSFKIIEIDIDKIGEITKIELVHKDGTTVAVDGSVRSFDNLLSDNEYTVRVTYVYDLENGEGKKTITEEFTAKTDAKRMPEIYIEEPYKTKTSIGFAFYEVDVDNVGEITKIELIHKDGTIVAVDNSVRSFDNLLSDNEYTVRVTYVYDLENGEGKKTITEEFTAKTDAKSVPEASISSISLEFDSISFELSEFDNDNVGEFTEIKLTYKDGVIIAESLDSRSFKGISMEYAYTLVVTYVYDLGNGEGEKTITLSESIETCETCIDDNRDCVCDACNKAIPCTDEDLDQMCDKCGAVVTVGTVFGWNTTQLKFALNHHSHSGELSSGAKKYLSGQELDDSPIIDDVIRRNLKAEVYTKTRIVWDDWDDTPQTGEGSYDWGYSHSYIIGLLESKASSNPDMYSTFLHDMMPLSLNRGLANLKTTQAGTNYFSFVREDNYAENIGDDEGYMMEAMESLTLNPNKMYLLFSDFFIDTVRAFFLVPANVDLLNQIGVSYKEKNGGTLPTIGAFKDRVGAGGSAELDGEFTIDDFIQLIWDREWTYDAIREYSEAVYQDKDSDLAKSAGDVLGFVLETHSGFSCSALLYTSSFTIVEKVFEDGKADFRYPAVTWNDATSSYVYDTTMDSNVHAEAFFALERSIQGLFASTGVFASSSARDINAKYAPTAKRELTGIRAKFKEGTLLFGGFIMTGHLEEQEFIDMSRESEGGFAIAPGPLYTAIKDTEYHDDTDLSTLTPVRNDRDEIIGYKNADGVDMSYRDYQTMMHNVARIGGIAADTKKFSQCTAYLDYQSTHSSDILDRYYEENLTSKAAAGDKNGNAEVMRFIRSHVRSVFDKAFEDAVKVEYGDKNAAATSWHNLLKRNQFQNNSAIGTNYSELAVKKQLCLDEIKAKYATLPEIGWN